MIVELSALYSVRSVQKNYKVLVVTKYDSGEKKVLTTEFLKREVYSYLATTFTQFQLWPISLTHFKLNIPRKFVEKCFSSLLALIGKVSYGTLWFSVVSVGYWEVLQLMALFLQHIHPNDGARLFLIMSGKCAKILVAGWADISRNRVIVTNISATRKSSCVNARGIPPAV